MNTYKTYYEHLLDATDIRFAKQFNLYELLSKSNVLREIANVRNSFMDVFTYINTPGFFVLEHLATPDASFNILRSAV